MSNMTMQLQEGTYEIAKGYRAVVIDKGTKVQILKKKVIYTGDRCRDCKHLLHGKYLFSPNQFWESYACGQKPKKVAGKNCFYGARSGAKACEMFERREESNE